MTVTIATPESIAHAAALLRAGDIVAFPTETVYGLGADARNAQAVAKVFAAKGRPALNPLIILAADIAALRTEVLFDTQAEELATHFWPGPLTLVLPLLSTATIAPIALAGGTTAAVRVERHPVARDMLKTFGGLIVAPSANLSGTPTPTTPQHVLESLGANVPLILAGGKATIGIESTILDLSGDAPRLLRRGAVTQEQIESVIGPVEYGTPLNTKPVVSKPIRLNVTQANADEGYLMFGPALKPGGKIALNLSEAGDFTEAAANLFTHLHTLQAADIAGIAVAPIPDTGLGAAINDRLRRGQ